MQIRYHNIKHAHADLHNLPHFPSKTLNYCINILIPSGLWILINAFITMILFKNWKWSKDSVSNFYAEMFSRNT